MAEAQIGVIGGSGLYEMEGLTDLESVRISTPFGDPSDAIAVGKLEGRSIAFLPRHGRGHRISPTNIPAQANIYALKGLGVQWLISVSAVGSMREEIAPGDIVVPDQIFDRTVCRPRTFFERDLVVHVGLAEPFCDDLRGFVCRSAQKAGAKAHDGGTYLCIEGPQFSTKAESRTYREWGVDVIGMTAIPEAKLAREAEMCYAMLAVATDYDSWHETEEVVTANMIVNNLNEGIGTAKAILRQVVKDLPEQPQCGCMDALRDAILTSPAAITPEVKQRFKLLIGKYV
jgi:5'-methylthioadenosine phosphorylase